MPSRRHTVPPTGVRVDVPGPPLNGEIVRLLRLQDGVITRGQLLELRETPGGVERRLRRRELVRVVDGVFVDHTGHLDWRQRAWVAVLHAWPAALCRESVWRQTDVVHVAIGPARRVQPMKGVAFHRTAGLDERVWWPQRPPRMRIEDAALDAAAAAADEFAAIAVLSEVVQKRLTTYDALAQRLASRARLRRGRWMREVLTDLALGTNSALEHAYLVRVERPHGLPVGSRQQISRAGGRPSEQDVSYEKLGVIVELDGRLFHDNARARDADFDRDLAAAVVEHARTVRLSWGQTLQRPCRTAEAIAALLRRGGWDGNFVRCPRCPPARHFT